MFPELQPMSRTHLSLNKAESSKSIRGSMLHLAFGNRRALLHILLVLNYMFI